MVGLCIANQLIERHITSSITVLDKEPKPDLHSSGRNRSNQSLENDFLCHPGPHSTHVLNTISPACTASFALADLIVDQAKIS